jgi:hypothetical protein
VVLLLNRNIYRWRTISREWCFNFHRELGIYRGEWDLHRLGEVGLAPGGGWQSGWSSLHRHSPSTRASPPHVDMWQPRLKPNHLKAWSASRPLGPLSLGSGPLGPHVKYTSVVMMILAFSQLHFVIPWNAPIWYLSSWNQINTKIVELVSRQGEYMVILYICLTCSHLKPVFYEHQQVLNRCL